MAETPPYKRIDAAQLEELQQLEHPALRIRWWIVLPFAILLSGAQAALALAPRALPYAEGAMISQSYHGPSEGPGTKTA